MEPLAPSVPAPSPGLSLPLPSPAEIAPGSTVLVLSAPQTTSLRRGMFLWATAFVTLGFVAGRVSKRCRPKKHRRPKKRRRR